LRIFEISAKPIDFVRDYGIDPVSGDVFDHCVELLTARLFCRFHVDERFDDPATFLLREFLAFFELRGNGVTFALLLFAADSRVNNGCFHL